MLHRCLVLRLVALTTAPGWASPDRAAPLDFQGRYLVSMSDADMLASAYVDGWLGPREGRDTISVMPLGRHVRDLRAYETEASNSVAGPPTAVAVTPNGRYAMVVETFKPRPDGNWQNQTFADLKHGNRIFVFDLSNPTRPTRVQELAIAERPTSISINRNGSLVSVTFHPSGAGAKTPLALIPFSNRHRHALIARAITGVSPEGLAISPDGRYVVTTNLERSYLPYDDERITWFSSLSFITLDPQTGQLNHVADYPFDGTLPEAAVFDASSQYLAVAKYDDFDDRVQGGAINFWRIAVDPLNPQPMLVQTRYSVPVTRGAHSVVLVP